MNVLVVLTTEYGRGHFDGSRLIVAELDQLAPGMFRTPATWPMLPHLERANWKPTNQVRAITCLTAVCDGIPWLTD
eukprot:7389807-Prymnesium_polylepis.1